MVQVVDADRVGRHRCALRGCGAAAPLHKGQEARGVSGVCAFLQLKKQKLYVQGERLGRCHLGDSLVGPSCR